MPAALLAVEWTQIPYFVAEARAAPGVKVRVLPSADQLKLPGKQVVLGAIDRQKALWVMASSMAWLKTTVTFVLRATPVALFTGVVLTTVGGGAAVLNCAE
jgi:hypothetical protein